jgi:hypothetical protein
MTLFGSANFKKCCSVGNCILSLFVKEEGLTDFNLAIKYFRDCRELTRTKDKVEKSLFLLEQYKKCIIDQRGNRLICAWKLPDNKEVCRISWAFLFDFKIHELENCSEQLKKDRGIVKLSTTAYTQRTLHSFTYTETMNLMDENFIEPGDQIYIFV